MSRPLRTRLSLAVSIAVSMTCAAAATASAQEPQVASHTTRNLATVEVTATPLGGEAESLAHPVEVLYGEALDARKAGTLGDTVGNLPGVQTTWFGAGVGRPIIRGQEGPRVQVLSGGLGSMDASTVSADHATSVEPFLADQIEVLKGPATLLFGSGAIGGAVNVVDGRIPSALPDRPLSGRAELRAGSGNDERTGLFRLDGVSGNWVIHVDGLIRNTGDYDIPGYARVEHDHDDDHDDHDDDDDHDDHDEQIRGLLPNSAVRTRSGALAATWLGERGHFGLSASTYRSNYGIPDGAHVHDDHDGGHDDDHDDHDHDDHDDDHDDHSDDHGPVRIDLVQNRLDLKAGVYDPVAFLSGINLRAAFNDYEHIEFEGDAIGTRFTSKGVEGRLEAVQKEWNGWRGAFGLQFGNIDFGASGDEAFVPPSKTETLGLFVIQEKEFGPWKLELGARHDRVEIDPEGDEARDFRANSLSAASIWHVNDVIDVRLGADLSERAPTNEELFAAGPHIATQSIELGDAGLDTERGRRLEVGLHAHTERVELKAAVYQTRFKDFIYLADTGVVDDGLPVRLWFQNDATFHGYEVEAKIHLVAGDNGNLDLRVFTDSVRAKLDGSGTAHVHFDVPHGDHSHHYHADIALDGNLPRIAPQRYGGELAWSVGNLRALLGATRYQKQDRVAEGESPSDGYTLVHAGLAYRFGSPDATNWEVFLDGRNLTDTEARPHTSLLRDYAPLPGRFVSAGLRVFF
jgi:iron complex outermembrane recepter protein